MERKVNQVVDIALGLDEIAQCLRIGECFRLSNGRRDSVNRRGSHFGFVKNEEGMQGGREEGEVYKTEKKN